MSKIKVIIPAYNEEKLLHVIKEIPNSVSEIIISNNSTDNTIKVAAGATVLQKTGKVWLCLLKRNGVHFEPIKPDIVVFLDGDYSDYPDELTQLIVLY
jgi:cellulose synthase/poly-beta-1,6-N-acetylglucosamine synthase-like glycosyltransferase